MTTPPFYIEFSEPPIIQCLGCVNINTKRFGGDADREVCLRHPYPNMQFLFCYCKDYRPSSHIRELISLIENILVKEEKVKIMEDVDGNLKKERK